jgi:SAM-dependent methyltransferase
MAIEDIAQIVSDRYARAASTGEQMCCPTGYNFDDLKQFIPEEVLKISYGCGTPAGLQTVKAGETVLDIGSGGGIDCFEASRLVGPTGHVIGLDMTDTMLEIARRNAPIVATHLGYQTPNVEFRKGIAEAMPVDDQTVDLVISNCVINLAPDKHKVFREMFRILRPGGRFTISDIVSDQTVPQYMVHDAEKWGNCLSGSLTLADYMGGMVDAGFRGVHQVKTIPWQTIDGIHFLSVTLTGYKLASCETTSTYATLRGPFSQATDELGYVYRRGTPTAIPATVATELSSAPLASFFILSDTPVSFDAADARWLAVHPEHKPCVWKGDFALFAGPFVEVHDDDHHRYRRGIPLEICSKTLMVLTSEPYRTHFTLYNRASAQATGSEVTCDPNGGCC